MMHWQKKENGGFCSFVPRAIAHKPPPLARFRRVVAILVAISMPGRLPRPVSRPTPAGRRPSLARSRGRGRGAGLGPSVVAVAVAVSVAVSVSLIRARGVAGLMTSRARAIARHARH